MQLSQALRSINISYIMDKGGRKANNALWKMQVILKFFPNCFGLPSPSNIKARHMTNVFFGEFFVKRVLRKEQGSETFRLFRKL